MLHQKHHAEHTKNIRETHYSHMHEKENRRLCAQLPVPAKGLLTCCVQETKPGELHRMGQNPRNTQETQSLFPFWGASCIVMICEADGILSCRDVLGSFGTSRPSLKHPEEVAKWATCFETVLH